MKKLFVILLFVIICIGLSAQTYSKRQFRVGNPASWVSSNAYDTKVFNVLDYGADPTGVANSTDEIQAAIDAADNGTIYFPKGMYLVDSLCIRKSPVLQGCSMWGDNGDGSKIFSTSEFPIIHIMNMVGYEWGFGAKIRDLHIDGSGHSDAGEWQQTGIKIDAQTLCEIRNVYISDCGDYAIRLGMDYHTILVTIRDCQIQNNTKGGIYGRTTGAKQINGIRIYNNHIIGNLSHGIDLVGTNVDIIDNIIESNDSCGIFVSARDMGNTNCTVNGMLIDGNYFENNAGGNIYMEYYYDNSPVVVQFITNVRIDNNYFDLATATLSGNLRGLTAQVTIDRASGSFDLITGVRDLWIGKNNNFQGTNAVWVDCNNKIDYHNVVEISSLTATPTTEYIGMGTYDSGPTKSLYGEYFGNPTWTTVTATGISASSLRPVMYISCGSAIDITTNPQFGTGVFGQVITLIGLSDTNTLLLEDGNGLVLAGAASFTIGANDIIRFIFIDDGWVEISRSNN